MTPARLLLSLFASATLVLPAMAQDAAPPAEKSAVVAPPATSAKPVDEPLPPNAPKEDYEFVGWCAGALTGHMALYDRVQPTLKEISKRWKTEDRDAASYEAQQKAGRDILAGFAEAMRSAEKASTQALAPRGAKAISQGRDMWGNIENIDDNAKAYSWLNWGLPGRCETTAAKLRSRSTLMGALLRDNSESAVQTSAVRAVSARPDTAPAKAEPQPEAPAPAAAPVATPVMPTATPTPAKPKTAVAATPAPVAAKPAAAKPAPAVTPKPAAKPAATTATTTTTKTTTTNPAKAAGLR